MTTMPSDRLTRLAALYPSLATDRQRQRFHFERGRIDDSAIIAAHAAILFQDTPRHLGRRAYIDEVCIDAWGDAINGGIIVC